MIGPVIGALLYNSLGYFATFLILGIILFINLMITYFFCPDYFDKSIQETETIANPESVVKEVNFKTFLLNKRSNFAFISCAFVNISICYSSAFFTDVLKNEKQIDPYYHGFVLSFAMFTYTISSI